MKNALILPFQQIESGFRVADVVDNQFEVASPLFWVSCPDEVNADEYWYNPENQEFVKIVVLELPAEPVAQPTISGAQTL